MTTIPTRTRAEHLRNDLRELRLNLSNIWFQLRPVITTKGRLEQTREDADRAGFLRGRDHEHHLLAERVATCERQVTEFEALRSEYVEFKASR